MRRQRHRSQRQARHRPGAAPTRSSPTSTRTPRGSPPAATCAAPLGDATAAAADALRAVRDKIEDYFTRCRLAAFDPRAQTALAGQDAELVALATQDARRRRRGDRAAAARARSSPAARLAAARGDQPGVGGARSPRSPTQAVTPILGARDALTAGRSRRDRRASSRPFEAWRTAQARRPRSTRSTPRGSRELAGPSCAQGRST